MCLFEFSFSFSERVSFSFMVVLVCSYKHTDRIYLQNVQLNASNLNMYMFSDFHFIVLQNDDSEPDSVADVL